MKWLYYIAKVHCFFSKEEFLNSTHKEIADLWKEHCKFNGWTKAKKEKEVKKVNVEDIFF